MKLRIYCNKIVSELSINIPLFTNKIIPKTTRKSLIKAIISFFLININTISHLNNFRKVQSTQQCMVVYKAVKTPPSPISKAYSLFLSTTKNLFCPTPISSFPFSEK